MGILDQQLNMSKAAANGRTVPGQAGEEWVLNNLAMSQLRTSEIPSQLISGFYGGGEDLGAGRGPFMYPDNRGVFNGQVVVNDKGLETINTSKTAAKPG